MPPTDPTQTPQTAQHGSIYSIGNASEIARLLNKSRLMTRSMGGLIPDILDPTRLGSVLDIGCGPGAWALDLACTYPEMRVVGVDISSVMVAYASEQARELGIENVQFRQMDALAPLDFADESFDLVNTQYLLEFMPKHGWSHIMREGLRLLRPAGSMRMTEYELGFANSPAHEHLCRLFIDAMSAADRCFSPGDRHMGILPMLAPTMRKEGFEHVALHPYAVDYSCDAEMHEERTQDLMMKVRLTFPFLVQMGKGTRQELERMADLMQEQMKAPNFMALWHFLTVRGQKPPRLSLAAGSSAGA